MQKNGKIIKEEAHVKTGALRDLDNNRKGK